MKKTWFGDLRDAEAIRLIERVPIENLFRLGLKQKATSGHLLILGMYLLYKTLNFRSNWGRLKWSCNVYILQKHSLGPKQDSKGLYPKRT